MRDGADVPVPPDEAATDQPVLERLVDGGTCTLDELADLASDLLAGTMATDRRIGERVDGRTVRYYTTNGLLPRPFVGSDRRARYGRDHLVRLLAVRRLQAGGVTLADAYRHLAGSDADTVEQLAQLPVELTHTAPAFAASALAAPAAAPAPPEPVRPFWGTPPSAPAAGSVVVLAPGLRLVSDTPLDVPASHVLAAAGPLLALLTPKENPR